MAVLYTDNFNRANETPLATGTWGQSGTGSFNLATNEVSHPNDAGDNEVYLVAATALGDQYAQVKMTNYGTGTGDTGLGVICRHIGSSTRTFFRTVMSQDTITVRSYTGGSGSTVGSRAGTFVVNDVLRVDVLGTSPNIIIRVYVNGVQQGADFTGVSGPNTGKPGMCYSSSPGFVSALDDWEAGDFTAGGTDATVVTGPAAASGQVTSAIAKHWPFLDVQVG